VGLLVSEQYIDSIMHGATINVINCKNNKDSFLLVIFVVTFLGHVPLFCVKICV